jgi:hypothetical protein
MKLNFNVKPIFIISTLLYLKQFIFTGLTLTKCLYSWIVDIPLTICNGTLYPYDNSLAPSSPYGRTKS